MLTTTLINLRGMKADDRERLLKVLFQVEEGKAKLCGVVRYRAHVLSIVTEGVA